MSTRWKKARQHWRVRLLNIPASLAGLPRRRWHNVQRVLQAVLWFDPKGEGCWACGATLREKADLSRTTFVRAKRDAYDLGLLISQRRNDPGRNGGRLPDLVRVDIGRLAELFDQESEQAPNCEEKVTSLHETTASPQRETVADPECQEPSRESRREIPLHRARALLERLTPDQRARLALEARLRNPELAVRTIDGRRVFEEGVAPLLAEWGELGLARWLSEAA